MRDADKQHIPIEMQRLIEKRTDQIFQQIEVKEILQELQDNLDPKLKYHCFEHTVDVIKEVIVFATLGEVDDTEVTLLGIAAAFHDAGYLTTRVRNEPIGAALARATLIKNSNYSEDQIKLVEQWILDTQLYSASDGPLHRPQHALSTYLIDADVSNLGREDFFEKTELLRDELSESGLAYYQGVLGFLQKHQWCSDSGIKLRSQQKNINIQKLKEKIYKEDQDPNSKPLLSVSEQHLQFISQLSITLNSIKISKEVIRNTLQALARELNAEAATVFLHASNSKELEFWALTGAEAHELEGKKIPYEKGIAGWVLQNGQSACVDDVHKDPRFFEQVDEESKFYTNNTVCVPLIVNGERTIGTLQLLNKTTGNFSDRDVCLMEHVAPQIATAIENSRLLEAVQQQQLSLEALDRRKREVMSIISHEFRTPLNIIQNSAELLTMEELDPESKLEMLEALKSGVNRLSTVIHQVVNVGQVESKFLNLNQQKVAVVELFTQLDNYFSPVLEQRNLILEINLGTDNLQIVADPALISIVFKNIISNSIRFTPDQGVIKLSAELQTGMANFKIEDTGIGIPKSELPLIFEKFYEVKDSMEHTSGTYEFQSSSLGLGLNAVKTILNAHGATISIDSVEEQGTTVCFSLVAAEF